MVLFSNFWEGKRDTLNEAISNMYNLFIFSQISDIYTYLAYYNKTIDITKQRLITKKLENCLTIFLAKQTNSL